MNTIFHRAPLSFGKSLGGKLSKAQRRRGAPPLHVYYIHAKPGRDLWTNAPLSLLSVYLFLSLHPSCRSFSTLWGNVARVDEGASWAENRQGGDTIGINNASRPGRVLRWSRLDDHLSYMRSWKRVFSTVPDLNFHFGIGVKDFMGFLFFFFLIIRSTGFYRDGYILLWLLFQWFLSG